MADMFVFRPAPVREGIPNMRILAVTNMYPTRHTPASGVFIEQLIKGLKQIGLEVDLIFVDRTQRGMSVYLGLRRHLRAKIAHFRPDVVHVMYGGVMADQVTQAVYNSPTVVTFHGSDLLGEHLSGSIRKLLASYGVWASWRAARRANGIVVVSKILQDTLPKDVDRSKTRIIPCGIDLERFKPLNRDVCRNSLGWSSEHFHVLFPTNAGDPVKRPGLARAAVEAVNRLGIHAEMHQLQGVPNHQVPVWLNASDVVLLTSLHEGSPTIIKEALACNVPVVSVDVGDVCERIQGIAGCYLALPDPDDLADKLLLIHTGPHRVEGRSNIQAFSLERIALRLKEFYGEVVTDFSNT
jgi:teichuronic acid biosynthesis glycosyltransferase TuaC